MEGMSLEKIKAEKLDGMFSASSKAVITAHIHPDGDACGCSLALARYLGKRGVDATVVLPEPVPETLSFIEAGTDVPKILSGTENPEESAAAVGGADLIVCVDCNSFSRTGVLESLLRTADCAKVLIDHHLAPETECFGLVFSETKISSACELLYEILLMMPDVAGKAGNLPGYCCRALMAGMTTDTNNFANSVYPSTLAMASALLEAGVDRDALLSELYNQYRENRLRLMGYLLHENLKITEWGVAYMIIDDALAAEFEIREGETEGFVNLPLAIGKVKMSIMLKEDGDGFFRVSVRSKKGYSSQKCAAAYFHGGGHENASGGRLFFPGDIASAGEAGSYITKVTERFFNDEGYI